MRLSIVTGEYHPMRGGVGDFTRELSLALCRAGHEIHILSPLGSTIGTQLQPASCILHPVIRRWSFPALFQIRKLAKQLGLDLLNVQYQALAYGMSLPIHFLPRIAGVPVVVTFHDLLVPYLFPKVGPLRRAVVSMLARSSAGVIVTNNEDEHSLLNLQSPVSNLSLIPIGSNFRVAPPPDYNRVQFRSALGLAPGEWLIGFFGFLNASKGGETLLEAMEILVNRGLPVRLSLIGGNFPGLEPSRLSADFVSQPGISIPGQGARHDSSVGGHKHHQRLSPLDPRARLGDRVLLTGYLDAPDVSAHLLACDVVALPYPSGATLRSGSFMAALLHGCPIVITEPLVPMPELRDGENVKLIPRGDAEATASAIEQLLAAPGLCARLSDGARALAQQFDWDTIAAQTGKFLEEVISSHRGVRAARRE